MISVLSHVVTGMHENLNSLNTMIIATSVYYHASYSGSVSRMIQPQHQLEGNASRMCAARSEGEAFGCRATLLREATRYTR